MKTMLANFDLSINTEVPHSSWDSFVMTTPGGHHAQTSEWGRVKAFMGWKAKRVMLTKDDQILGGAQILIRRTRLGVNVGYVTKGPLVVGESADLARIVLRKISEISDQHHCQLMAIQPPNNGHYLVDLLEELNYCRSSLELAPTATLVMDLSEGEDALLKQMKQKTRQHINHSLKAGFEIREGTREDLDTFFDLYCCTAKRQGFVPFKRAYFNVLWDAFAPRNWISLLMICYQGEAITGQILIPFGDTVISKMIGWSGKHSDLRPNEATYWASIVWAMSHGYRYFDFEGVAPDEIQMVLQGNPCENKRDTFKYGFGGKPTVYPPAYDYLPNPVTGWVYHRFKPNMEGNDLFSRMLEILRKR
jgi:lipid II:glycine glycyltransferase (peptidoglycan interpeptide bridge formation enzyme)